MRQRFRQSALSGPRVLKVVSMLLALSCAALPLRAEPAARPPEKPDCNCNFPDAAARASESPPATTYTHIRPHLDRHDEIAALEAVQIALTQVGDGASYVWYRHGGRLSGIVQPTQSFRDYKGRICRHLFVTLSAVGQSKRTGAIACRLADGSWELDG